MHCACHQANPGYQKQDQDVGPHRRNKNESHKKSDRRRDRTNKLLAGARVTYPRSHSTHSRLPTSPSGIVRILVPFTDSWCGIWPPLGLSLLLPSGWRTARDIPGQSPAAGRWSLVAGLGGGGTARGSETGCAGPLEAVIRPRAGLRRCGWRRISTRSANLAAAGWAGGAGVRLLSRSLRIMLAAAWFLIATGEGRRQGEGLAFGAFVDVSQLTTQEGQGAGDGFGAVKACL